MNWKDNLKMERFPANWCAGCGISIIINEVAKLVDKNTVIVSGIGCSGRAAGYFNLDTVHGAHGRAIPLAEGIKRGNEKLNVIVISGDGDLLGIGLNHLLHSSRRDVNITVICVNNEIYGMTGGQLSPTTKEGIETLTSPKGNVYKPINAYKLIKANDTYFYARTTVFHREHMSKAIKKALDHKGFSFVEIISNCFTNYGRRLGFNSAFEMIQSYKDFKINNKGELKDNEIGIRNEDNI